MVIKEKVINIVLNMYVFLLSVNLLMIYYSVLNL